ncbi:hypothetical protein [Nocardioides sp.]|uniref:hypothetical protein n=1 Tax=Nocardioides sp. TaxID=35761 RepID=UPI002ED96B1B
MNRLVALALPLVSAVLISLVPGGTAHAADPDTAPVIQTAGLSTETGGLSGYLPISCVVRVEFTDQTPSDAEDYAISVEGRDGAGASHQYDGLGQPVPDAFTIGLPCGDLADGQHTVTVREHPGEAQATESEPAAFSYRVIDHPSRLDVAVPKVRGTYSVYAGRRYRLRPQGTWEARADISTRMWTSKRRSVFTSDDWTANTSGKAAVVSVDSADAMVATFRVPRRLAGRWLWISVLGRTGAWGADGVADYRYTFIPLKVLPPKR